MGNRLSKIVTRTGDSGTTGLGDGSRVGKDSPRIDTLGELDELNSSIGVLLAEHFPSECQDLHAALLTVQNHLFDLGGEICIPGHKSITEEHVAQLEGWAEDYNSKLSPLKEFILPGGTRAAALAHLSRTICRRAERSIVHLGHNEAVSDHARQYLNRLSDLLFVIGRTLNRAGGNGDVLWKNNRSQ
ncbi:MAG: cob(I)yrinic acid a,c-diamide adenosyltransferase [Rhodocyclaceae bacterium]|nr:cob(I)yrinic acid a,c-diamide adenosyltransferase [Rhodocyclaceae bacterium]